MGKERELAHRQQRETPVSQYLRMITWSKGEPKKKGESRGGERSLGTQKEKVKNRKRKRNSFMKSRG